ncbi:Arylsulfatase regulator (Fe-S oxidoreductase) [Frankia canadensis]|uniref:Arylsulfatase regulator (Fe-S oxidoreductase) n=1 Tax=Frankia canadensis TaxID=1836972 RepID=A0A2I2KR19_9ACTN|nr:multiple cyclophane-containing RiPP AmcA [Frankia canadensis]SNQ48115.1 Arylsulfatase regulator (Fe-S oxidoreductase) [Frankia canadensis]SOU55405.1 Arylsulfatase regulator (Fe-S oxidoreductase) [Frankia canadensis]
MTSPEIAMETDICSIVLQPTTLCNLNCDYCYLPDRAKRRVMEPGTARAVAESIRSQALRRGGIDVVWHGGEPLTLGHAAFSELLEPFSGMPVTHVVQTNATLINAGWLALFEKWEIEVGVSIDGNRAQTRHRVDRAGSAAFDRIMRGIERLRSGQFAFDVIAVVAEPEPEDARELYEFVVELGCRSLAVNIEEREGSNTRVRTYMPEKVRGFWAALADAWIDNPAIPVRELERVRHAMAPAGETSREIQSRHIDPFPTVAWNGDVTLISPELAGYTPFSCGNVREKDLHQIIQEGMLSSWISEYRRGLSLCGDNCAYFDFCEGGHPANRFFEHGRFDTTETDYCRNTKIALVDGCADDGPKSRGPDIKSALLDSDRMRRLLAIPEFGAGNEMPARFDNRPTWDNRGNNPPFDNRPAWDNWDKKGWSKKKGK